MRWQQGKFVGGGTFGSVYEATNLDSGFLMAVKEIRLQDPQLIPTIAGQIKDEMGVLEVLDHPNVVSYLGIEVHRDKVYIFMEYCSGGSLAGLLDYGRIEDEQVIMVYALQLLEGLAYLHESGIVHRDIKPESKFPPFALSKPTLTPPRHPPRPQRRNQIRRLRRRQSHRPPRQNPHQRRHLHPPQSQQIHDRHPDVHVPRSDQRREPRPRRRRRRLVARLRDPRDGHWPSALGFLR